MRQMLESHVESFMKTYCSVNNQPYLWRSPRIRFAEGSRLSVLQKIVVPEHHLPTDFLPEANVVVSCFLPFKETIGQSNVQGRLASETWAMAYLVTNAMMGELNESLVGLLRALGYRTALPQDTGIIPKVLKSRWSQRHIAYLAGHGTFGVNNMLITDQGSCGRFFSLVAELPIKPDTPLQEERCLFKAKGACGVCIERCVTGALQADRFDREVCFRLCMENDARYSGADVCGKCVVGVPCSFTCP